MFSGALYSFESFPSIYCDQDSSLFPLSSNCFRALFIDSSQGNSNRKPHAPTPGMPRFLNGVGDSKHKKESQNNRTPEENAGKTINTA